MILRNDNDTPTPDAGEIFRLYYRPLCLYALHYVADTDDAEDIVQDCVTDFLEKSCSGLPTGSIKSYLFTMVRNRCIDTLRHMSRFDKSQSAEEMADGFADADEDEREEISTEESRLWTAIDSLPARCRDILLMGKRDGMKYEEIASELGISVNTVRNQMSKALNALKATCRKVYIWVCSW